jgi:integrative and conjugative element protein (TIGR02256 family)
MIPKSSRISQDRLNPPRSDEVSAWGAELALLAKVGISFRTEPLPGGGLEISIPTNDSVILRLQLLPGFPRVAPRLYLDQGLSPTTLISPETYSWTRGTRLVRLILSLRKRGVDIKPLEPENRFVLWLRAECGILSQAGFDASIRKVRDGSLVVLIQKGERRVGLRIDKARDGYNIELIRAPLSQGEEAGGPADGDSNVLVNLGHPEVSSLLEVARSLERNPTLWSVPTEAQAPAPEKVGRRADPGGFGSHQTRSTPEASSQVRLGWDVENFIAHQVANDSPKESAGLLLGDWSEESGWSIREATGPGPNATQDGGHICPDEKYLNAKKRDGERRGLSYLGEWHSHPAGFDRPSGGDEHSIRSKIQTMELSFYVAGIVPMDPGTIRLNLYLFRPSGLVEFLKSVPLPEFRIERREVRAWSFRGGR